MTREEKLSIMRRAVLYGVTLFCLWQWQHSWWLLGAYCATHGYYYNRYGRTIDALRALLEMDNLLGNIRDPDYMDRSNRSSSPDKPVA